MSNDTESIIPMPIATAATIPIPIDGTCRSMPISDKATPAPSISVR